MHTQRAQTTDTNTQIPNIIVFSHLRWEFVKQRPQHLLERFSQKCNILFVEEPIGFSRGESGTAKEISISENITVIQPRIEHNDFQSLKKVLNNYKTITGKNPIVWLYSASFLPILDYLQYSMVVYDCMDELSAFKGAPLELISMEKELLSIADVVFTGGKSLYESKFSFNDQTYCFPSSVDKKHFEKTFSKKTEIPTDIASLKKPIVGFYGVIDERIDLDLLSQVSTLNSHVSFVMVGPVVKINEADLPKADNIHYLGGKSYDLLPNYLKAFSIAMMPFALNESTRFISPTKTLEFMAAHKPIISTPIYDVQRDYNKEVSIVSSAEQFTKAIEKFLSETRESRQKRTALQKAVIDRTSWDQTAKNMITIMQETLTQKRTQKSMNSMLATNSSLAVQLAI